MHKIILSPVAMGDLERIYEYTADHWGVVQARKYLRALEAGIRTLARRPRLGRACADLPCKTYAVGRHLIMYRERGAALEVITILHKAMDIEQRLLEALKAYAGGR